MPLVIASGAGANSRRSLGTTVVGGLTVATILIIFVPIFYYVIERLREPKSTKRDGGSGSGSGQVAPDSNAKTQGAK
jgi:HAE1 family hydrophobic/amphiphilic exporter-1